VHGGGGEVVVVQSGTTELGVLEVETERRIALPVLPAIRGSWKKTWTMT
jgi:hypothetical protein